MHLSNKGYLFYGALFAAIPVLIAPLAAQQDDASPLGRDERMRGLVRPSKQVALAPSLDGIIVTIDVQEGEAVQADQVLARMDNAVQQQVVAVAKLQAEAGAEIRRQQLLLEESQIQLERMVELEKSNAAQEWEVRRARVQRDANQAALDAAKHQNTVARQQLELEREKLNRYLIKAPFSGRVMRIATEAGAAVTHNDPVLNLVALDKLEAQLYLPVELYGKVEQGKVYRFTAEQPVNRQLEGRLTVIEPIIDSASQTFRCVFEIDNPQERLPAGFTVRLLWPQ